MQPMQPQWHREDQASMDFLFRHSNLVDVSRRPFTSAFHSYYDQHSQQPLSCSSHETHNQTDESDEDDDHNSHVSTERGAEVDHTDDDSERADRDIVCGIAAGDQGGPASQQTSKNYSVAELLRSDRPSSSAVNDDHKDVKQSDSGRHGEEKPSPTDSAFRSYVQRQTGPLLPAFPHRHLWTDWMMSDSWLRPHLDNEAQQRCFGVFDAPPVNFIPTTYRHSRCGTELQLPLPTFGRRQNSVPRGTDHCRLTATGEKHDNQDQHHRHPPRHPQLQQQQEHQSAGRRQRTTFSAEQTLQLEAEYQRVEYVARPRRCELAQSLGLTDTQVKIWFQNRRAKDKRIEKAHFDRHIRSMQVMYSLNKNSLLDQVVDTHRSPSTMSLPTTRSIPSTIRKNADSSNWKNNSAIINIPTTIELSFCGQC